MEANTCLLETQTINTSSDREHQFVLPKRLLAFRTTLSDIHPIVSKLPTSPPPSFSSDISQACSRLVCRNPQSREVIRPPVAWLASACAELVTAIEYNITLPYGTLRLGQLANSEKKKSNTEITSPDHHGLQLLSGLDQLAGLVATRLRCPRQHLPTERPPLIDKIFEPLQRPRLCPTTNNRGRWCASPSAHPA